MRAIEGRHPGYREMTESIYDVPSSLLRRLSEQNIGEYSEGDWMPENGSNPDTDEIRSQHGSVGWTAL
ncbi:hypothetical protein AGOR_G00222740 [Albula goreensis]|uniref:Uncharacterized protein n=1 Tax=Albula goreensis TaxID=1534307 RepID=A0A8T3CLR5_9TELE|nr:hypothetical protein AGOR_G00222740 [Albula goreensis]